MTYLNRALRTLPTALQFQALGRLRDLQHLLEPTHEHCRACGRLEAADALFCTGCSANLAEQVPPVVLVGSQQVRTVPLSPLEIRRRRWLYALLAQPEISDETLTEVARTWLEALDREDEG